MHNSKKEMSDGRKIVFFFSSRRRHTRYWRDWSSDVCSSDLATLDNVAHFRRRGLNIGAAEQRHEIRDGGVGGTDLEALDVIRDHNLPGARGKRRRGMDEGQAE